MRFTAIFFVALLSAVLTSCTQSRVLANVQTQADITPVGLGVVSVLDQPDRQQYSAVLAPDAQTDLAFREPGYVTEVLQVPGGDGRLRSAEPGDTVPAGAVLARIRPAEYRAVVDRVAGSLREVQASIQATEAQLQQAEAAAEQAELDFRRADILWAQESITKPAYDASLAKRDIARAAVSAAKAAVRSAGRRADSVEAQQHEAQISLNDTVLTAPYASTVLERKVERGSLVSVGSIAFTVGDLRRIKARFNVPDAALTALKIGQTVPVTLAAFPEHAFSGRVLSIARAADPHGRSFEVQVLLENSTNQLRSGMIATVSVDNSVPVQRLAVPAAAAIHDPVGGRYQLYVVKPENGKLVARRQNVDVSPGPNGLAVLTSGSLQAGDRVVVSGAMLVRDGDAVQQVQ